MNIYKQFQLLGDDFSKEFEKVIVIQNFPGKTELIKEGQYIKFIPIVMKGLVKVFAINEDRELLYYYIRPQQSCIMSISAIFKHSVSKIYAITEEETEIILIPSDQILKWVVTYPNINSIFYEEYERRYVDMMEMVNQAVFHRLDKRLMGYLGKRIAMNHNNPIKISHKEIANDLGTAREVVSRLLKKFENEGNIRKNENGIEIIAPL